MLHPMQAPSKRLLIIGGYGTFGGWFARLLADDARVTLLIAGRSRSKADTFISENQRQADMQPVVFDRNGDVSQQIQSCAAEIVVDASGPFQAYGADPYRVVKACIANGVNYVDLADDSDFVIGIIEQDKLAREKNVFALSGVSTCVALSSAVFRHLAINMTSINALRGGIAPSPHAGVGMNVMRAVAITAGKPTSALLDHRIQSVYPFTNAQRRTIAPPGVLPMYQRVFSLAAVPDLITAQAIKPSSATIWFGAAPVPAVFHAMLRVLARTVKWGWLPSLEFLAPLMNRVMRDFAWGEHRGGMFIEVEGSLDGKATLTRSWHLIAEGDDGPAIPAMASAAIIRRCLDGNSPDPGARTAVNELELGDFQPYFDRMSIRAGERLSQQTEDQPLFQQVLGSAWDELPQQIRQLHDVSGSCTLSGSAKISRGTSLVARVIGSITGFPPAGKAVPLSVSMNATNGRERWTRDFDGHRFSSVMSLGRKRAEHLLQEQFGPAKFALALVWDGQCLHYVPRSWTFLGVPLPRRMAPQGKMIEFVENDVFHFHVEIKLPIIGMIVTYQGHLKGESK